MATILHADPFDEDLLPLVMDFDCSEKEPPEFWEEEINEWIRADPATEDGAIFWMRKGTQVWLYTDEHHDLVGYGSLCISPWPDKTILRQVPRLKSVPINMIPAVGINRRFRGGPAGAERDQRYSTLIMKHLIYEAAKHTDRQPFIGLHVHPQNVKAIALYRRMNFEDFPKVYNHHLAGVGYPAMILKISAFPFSPEG